MEIKLTDIIQKYKKNHELSRQEKWFNIYKESLAQTHVDVNQNLTEYCMQLIVKCKYLRSTISIYRNNRNRQVKVHIDGNYSMNNPLTIKLLEWKEKIDYQLNYDDNQLCDISLL
ncbi:hypothetical protein LNTAR_25360 [Lentisphaera araneosa HTCC2155]|uniref:Uncharacterized protein n=1 Tax=Lentisphaera araneosa HTCC2155 TaxID=313628 RepID=A6DSB4_9BACT|nr:hypothetical protein [Lentisphaera araneosa]EDM25459.1 hypothetical protein LNTAR_25360 [Lentisphaera araneosa HTCC2155]